MKRKRERLAQRRKMAGHSQKRQAEVLRIERSTVARWEQAETEPRPWLRPRLTKALGIPNAPSNPAALAQPPSLLPHNEGSRFALRACSCARRHPAPEAARRVRIFGVSVDSPTGAQPGVGCLGQLIGAVGWSVTTKAGLRQSSDQP